jgi:hypothetical protein
VPASVSPLVRGFRWLEHPHTTKATCLPNIPYQVPRVEILCTMYVPPAGKILTIRGPWNIRGRFSPRCDGRRQAIDLRFVTGLFLVPDWEMEVDSEPGFFWSLAV